MLKNRTSKTQVSMLRSDLFDKLVNLAIVMLCAHDSMIKTKEYIARTIRKNESPFGGIQVISIF